MIKSRFYIKESKNTISSSSVNNPDGTTSKKQEVITDLILVPTDDDKNLIKSGEIKVTFTDYDSAKYFDLNKEYEIDFTIIN